MVPPPMDPQQNHQYQQWMMMNQQAHQPPVQPQSQPAAMYYHQQSQQQPVAASPQYQFQQQQQQQPPQYPSSAAQPASGDEIRTLWIGDLQPWMDEQYLISSFSQTGEVVSAKVIRNKQTSQSEGYGFVEFASHAAAERNLQAFNGTLMPNVEQNFRLNWASFGVGEKRPDDTPEFTIFVGDLAADVTDYTLQETFRPHYSSLKGAKVVTDRTTGRTKGYGFVKFGDESEQVRAMTEMNGKFCSTRPMRIGPAANKKNVSTQQYSKASYPDTQGNQSEDDPNNTTIFVGGLDTNVTEDHLRQLFSQYGQIVHVKIPMGKRCGFVQFADRSCAEEALRVLNGTQLCGQSIRLSWGRSHSAKQTQQQVDPNQWNGGGGYYGYAAAQQGYGYPPAAAAQDPNMYYGGFPGYGNYSQPQQHQHQQQ